MQLEPTDVVQSVESDELQSQGAQVDTGRDALRIGESESVITLAEAEAPNIDHGESGGMEEGITQSLQVDTGKETTGVIDVSEGTEITTQGFQADTGTATASGVEGAQGQGIVDCCRVFRCHNPIWLGP